MLIKVYRCNIIYMWGSIMYVFKKLLLRFFSVIILLSTPSIVFADGHGKCKPSKWGADDEIGAANFK